MSIYIIGGIAVGGYCLEGISLDADLLVMVGPLDQVIVADRFGSFNGVAVEFEVGFILNKA